MCVFDFFLFNKKEACSRFCFFLFEDEYISPTLGLSISFPKKMDGSLVVEFKAPLKFKES